MIYGYFNVSNIVKNRLSVFDKLKVQPSTAKNRANFSIIAPIAGVIFFGFLSFVPYFKDHP